MMKIKIAIPSKGRISEPSINILEKAGLGLIDKNNRKLISKTFNDDIEVMFARASDIPEFVNDGVADMDNEGTRAQSTIGVAIAELTVGRLVLENNPILTVTNDKGETVLSIPLIDYALLVKGHYNREMSDQEYLDRQDEYNMTFFLDENGHWANSTIIINDWQIVLNDADLS